MSNAEDISIDGNGDGIPDIVVNHFDTDGDGRVDETVAVFDSDDDGAVDTRRDEHLVDIDGDGDTDRVSFVDSLGNQQTEVIVDLNADDTDDVIDGQAASKEGQTFLDTPAGQAFVSDPFGDTAAAHGGTNGADGGVADPPFTPAPPPADGVIISTPHDDDTKPPIDDSGPTPPTDGRIIPTPHDNGKVLEDGDQGDDGTDVDDGAKGDDTAPPIVVTVPSTGPFHEPPPPSADVPHVSDDDPSFGTGASDGGAHDDNGDNSDDGATDPTAGHHAPVDASVIADPDVHTAAEATTAATVAASAADIDDPSSLIDDVRDGFGAVVGDLLEDIEDLVD
jgi:hypothetical protein